MASIWEFCLPLIFLLTHNMTCCHSCVGAVATKDHIFDEELVVVTMIWPFKSFMSPNRERQTNFAAFRRHLHPGRSGEEHLHSGHLRGPQLSFIFSSTLTSQYKVQSGWSGGEFIVCLGPKGWPRGPLEPSHLPLCSKFNPSHPGTPTPSPPPSLHPG